MSAPYYYVSYEIANWITLCEPWAIKECWDDDKIMSMFNSHFDLQWNQFQMYDTFSALKRNYGPFPQAMENKPWYKVVNKPQASDPMATDMDIDEEAWAVPQPHEMYVEVEGNEFDDYLAEDADDEASETPESFSTISEQSTSSTTNSTDTSSSEAGPQNRNHNRNHESNRGSGNRNQGNRSHNKHNNTQNQNSRNGRHNDRGQKRQPDSQASQQGNVKREKKTCTSCGKVGHISAVCRSKPNDTSRGHKDHGR